jgi:hypothetical protein
MIGFILIKPLKMITPLNLPKPFILWIIRFFEDETVIFVILMLSNQNEN